MVRFISVVSSVERTMSVSVVFGGQFGSEGKGKVAHEFARRFDASVVVRVGGANSGHTVIDQTGKPRRFRALPTGSILRDTICVIAAGSYIDVDVLLAEIAETGLDKDRVLIDPRAILISAQHKEQERTSNLRSSIGSTLSGTGAAVISRIRRDGGASFAENDERLKPYIRATRRFLRERLKKQERIVIEGTQGFGLSVLHSDDYPQVTSRDTSAAAFVSETGLSPLDVDEVVMVIRAFPIRVSGNSGPLPNEIDWDTVTMDSGYQEPVMERTTVTGNVRRIARFNPDIVRASIEANSPNLIVLNHLDYIDATCRRSHVASATVERFVSRVEGEIQAKIDFLGFGPASISTRNTETTSAASA